MPFKPVVWNVYHMEAAAPYIRANLACCVWNQEYLKLSIRKYQLVGRLTYASHRNTLVVIFESFELTPAVPYPRYDKDDCKCTINLG